MRPRTPLARREGARPWRLPWGLPKEGASGGARGAAPRPGPLTGQADLAAGRGSMASAAILKEMEGRRAQRLKQPGGDVVGQGKGIRGAPEGRGCGARAGRGRSRQAPQDRIGGPQYLFQRHACQEGTPGRGRGRGRRRRDSPGVPGVYQGVPRREACPSPQQGPRCAGGPPGPLGAAPKRAEPGRGLQISVGRRRGGRRTL